MAGFVLQYNNCIVTRAVEWLKLYCNMVGLKGLKGCFFVLQYTWCIVAKKGLGAEDCIAIRLLYCNLGGWMTGVLCHNTLQCIVTNRGSSSVSQYWASRSSTVIGE